MRRSIDSCPTCGAPVSPFVKLCPYCGGDVSRRSQWRARKLKAKRRMRQIRHRAPNKKNLRKVTTSLTTNTDTPFVVGALVLANIFAYFAFDLGGDLFSDPGALSADSVRACEWYRLLSYQFLHTGVLELVFSVLLLAVFAVAIEQRLGHFAALATYLLSGVVGGLIAVIFQFDAVLAGSLVSTLGLMGAWLVTVASPHDYEERYPLPAALVLVAVMFAYGFIQEGESPWVLLGGLAAGGGFAFAMRFRPTR